MRIGILILRELCVEYFFNFAKYITKINNNYEMKTRLLFFVMMLCALKISADVTSLSGSGTSDDPYLINTVDELGRMRFQVNKGSNSYSTACYKLMTDLDFSWEGDWTPIGKDEDFPFMGIFDGNNKIIKNIKLGRKDHPITGYAYIGFWGCIKNARILNLGIEWEGLHSSISSTRESYSGGIVGYCNGSSIENC